MKRLLIFILITLLISLLPISSIFARGTASGIVITNARDLNGNDAADAAGEVIGSFTNLSGNTNYARATNITVCTVNAAYDLSVISTPADSSASPGGYADYDYSITNYGNVSAQMIVRISSNAATVDWGAVTYSLYTNFSGGYGLLNGPALFVSNTLIAVAPDTAFDLRIRVHAPGAAQDGATNEYLFEIWDPAWTGAGDAWPGAGAISPATPDTGDARDYQTDYVTTTISGPIIQMVKSVDVTTALPYEVLTYSLWYTNSGSGAAYNVVIDDVIFTNYVVMLADSAETNNTATHSPTNFYYDGSWQAATFDTGNESSISRLRWRLRNPVATGESGTLEFKVRIK